jgi:hypothetical protein
MLEGETVYFPHIVSWLADGVAKEFNFHADRPAASTAKINAVTTVAADGTVTDVTATITPATDGVTFGTEPASGVMVVCYYEHNGTN